MLKVFILYLSLVILVSVALLQKDTADTYREDINR